MASRVGPSSAAAAAAAARAEAARRAAEARRRAEAAARALRQAQQAQRRAEAQRAAVARAQTKARLAFGGGAPARAAQQAVAQAQADHRKLQTQADQLVQTAFEKIRAFEESARLPPAQRTSLEKLQQMVRAGVDTGSHAATVESLFEGVTAPRRASPGQPAPGFDAVQVANTLYDAMKGGLGLGTNEGQIFEAFRGLTPEQVRAVRSEYRAHFNQDLDRDLTEELTGNDDQRVRLLLGVSDSGSGPSDGNEAAADAVALERFLMPLGAKGGEVVEVLSRRTPEYLNALRLAWTERHPGTTLEGVISQRLAGDDRAYALAVLGLQEGDLAPRGAGASARELTATEQRFLAASLRRAVHRDGTDEEAIWAVLHGPEPLSARDLEALRRTYSAMFDGASLDTEVLDDLDGVDRARAEALLQVDRPQADAHLLRHALEKHEAPEEKLGVLLQTFANRPAAEREVMSETYRRAYGTSLEADVARALPEPVEPGATVRTTLAGELLRTGEPPSPEALLHWASAGPRVSKSTVLQVLGRVSAAQPNDKPGDAERRLRALQDAYAARYGQPLETHLRSGSSTLPPIVAMGRARLDGQDGKLIELALRGPPKTPAEQLERLEALAGVQGDGLLDGLHGKDDTRDRNLGFARALVSLQALDPKQAAPDAVRDALVEVYRHAPDPFREKHRALFERLGLRPQPLLGAPPIVRAVSRGDVQGWLDLRSEAKGELPAVLSRISADMQNYEKARGSWNALGREALITLGSFAIGGFALPLAAGSLLAKTARGAAFLARRGVAAQRFGFSATSNFGDLTVNSALHGRLPLPHEYLAAAIFSAPLGQVARRASGASRATRRSPPETPLPPRDALAPPHGTLAHPPGVRSATPPAQGTGSPTRPPSVRELSAQVGTDVRDLRAPELERLGQSFEALQTARWRLDRAQTDGDPARLTAARQAFDDAKARFDAQRATARELAPLDARAASELDPRNARIGLVPPEGMLAQHRRIQYFQDIAQAPPAQRAPMLQHILPYAPVEERAAVLQALEPEVWRRIGGVGPRTQQRLLSLWAGSSNPVSRRAREGLAREVQAADWARLPPEVKAARILDASSSRRVHSDFVLSDLRQVPAAAPFRVVRPERVGEHPFAGAAGPAHAWRMRIDDRDIVIYAPATRLRRSGRKAPSSDPAAPHHLSVDEVMDAIARMPPEVRRLISSVHLNPTRSPHDAFWAERFKVSGFRASMTQGADGRVDVFPSTHPRDVAQLRGSFTHEAGHIATRGAWGNDAQGPYWDAWRDAMRRDGLDPSRYAGHNLLEDAAEAFELFALTRGTPLFDELSFIYGARFERLSDEYARRLL